MKRIVIAVLLAWFFTVNQEEGGLKMSTTVYGFKSQAACDSYREEMMVYFEISGIKAKFGKCDQKVAA